MAVTGRVDYEHTLQALGICVSARVPVLLWGNPGEGQRRREHGDVRGHGGSLGSHSGPKE